MISQGTLDFIVRVSVGKPFADTSYRLMANGATHVTS